eukprot:Opistho-1_new@53104
MGHLHPSEFSLICMTQCAHHYQCYHLCVWHLPLFVCRCHLDPFWLICTLGRSYAVFKRLACFSHAPVHTYAFTRVCARQNFEGARRGNHVCADIHRDARVHAAGDARERTPLHGEERHLGARLRPLRNDDAATRVHWKGEQLCVVLWDSVRQGRPRPLALQLGPPRRPQLDAREEPLASAARARPRQAAHVQARGGEAQAAHDRQRGGNAAKDCHAAGNVQTGPPTAHSAQRRRSRTARHRGKARAKRRGRFAASAGAAGERGYAKRQGEASARGLGRCQATGGSTKDPPTERRRKQGVAGRASPNRRGHQAASDGQARQSREPRFQAASGQGVAAVDRGGLAAA